MTKITANAIVHLGFDPRPLVASLQRRGLVTFNPRPTPPRAATEDERRRWREQKRESRVRLRAAGKPAD
jgi:hypothetical protein